MSNKTKKEFKHLQKLLEAYGPVAFSSINKRMEELATKAGGNTKSAYAKIKKQNEQKAPSAKTLSDEITKLLDA